MLHRSTSEPDPTSSPAEGSRRAFLQRTVATAAAVPALVLTGTSGSLAGPPPGGRPARPGSAILALNAKSSKARLAAAKANANAGAATTSSKFVTPLNRALFEEIQADEATHSEFLANALGGSARPRPTFQNLTASSVQQFVAMASTFENTGAGAYVTAAVYLNSPLNLFNSARIATVEGRHAGWLNSLLSEPLVPEFSPFEIPLTQQQVVEAVTPYIASLNGGPAPGYDLARSDANDINILNFALALEYLEATFYAINVPKFFG